MLCILHYVVYTRSYHVFFIVHLLIKYTVTVQILYHMHPCLTRETGTLPTALLHLTIKPVCGPAITQLP
jgi:hypothetical protein